MGIFNLSPAVRVREAEKMPSFLVKLKDNLI